MINYPHYWNNLSGYGLLKNLRAHNAIKIFQCLHPVFFKFQKKTVRLEGCIQLSVTEAHKIHESLHPHISFAAIIANSVNVPNCQTPFVYSHTISDLYYTTEEQEFHVELVLKEHANLWRLYEKAHATCKWTVSSQPPMFCDVISPKCA